MSAMRWGRWLPSVLLAGGGLLLFGIGQQQRPALQAPLATAMPVEVFGMAGEDAVVAEDEAAVAGFTDYAFRIYGDGEEAASPDGRWASIYIGFYESQTSGKTIHSPKNCLPGTGWEAISSTTADVDVASGSPVTVNRYVLKNGDSQALVLYWYQGRGRVAHNEYLVKWDLLRDAAVKRRTDEALVRIVVPILSSEEAAFELAGDIASELVSGVSRTLPAV